MCACVCACVCVCACAYVHVCVDRLKSEFPNHSEQGMGTRLPPYLALYCAIKLPNICHLLFVILHCLNLLPDSQLKTRATSVDRGSPRGLLGEKCDSE